MVTGPEITEKLTGKPEVSVALRVIGAAPYVWPASGPKLIVWLRGVNYGANVHAMAEDAREACAALVGGQRVTVGIDR